MAGFQSTFDAVGGVRSVSFHTIHERGYLMEGFPLSSALLRMPFHLLYPLQSHDHTIGSTIIVIHFQVSLPYFPTLHFIVVIPLYQTPKEMPHPEMKRQVVRD